jgi:AcrR family transcriptional regulator
MDAPTTRDRLIAAAKGLFAAHGYRGASVRDICNLARANPGAVSYHFGSKRQLYRTVLRHAAEGLVERTLARLPPSPTPSDPEVRVATALKHILDELDADPVPVQLVMHDLADGGGVVVETLSPTLATAFTTLRTATGAPDTPREEAMARLLFLRIAAPLFLLTAGWPVLERALGLTVDQRASLLAELVRGAAGSLPR